MRRIPMVSRSRVLACGILFCVLAAGSQGTAGSESSTVCSTTVCAVAGATVTIKCARPDALTVECEGEGTVTGSGRAHGTVGLPGAIEWRGEGRCGANCTSSQLQTAVGAWDGLVRKSNTITRLLRFPKVTRSSASRVCITYTAVVASYTEATTATLNIHVDSASATHSAYAEVIGFCNLAS